MVTYAWVSDKSKFNDAINDCKIQKLEATEENIKAFYVKRLGLLRNEEVEEVVAPKKKGGKK